MGLPTRHAYTVDTIVSLIWDPRFTKADVKETLEELVEASLFTRLIILKPSGGEAGRHYWREDNVLLMLARMGD